MKNKKYFPVIVGLLLFGIVILVPYGGIKLQDKAIRGRIGTLEHKPITVSKDLNEIPLSIDEKFELVSGCGRTTKIIPLDMGKMLSRYEAKKAAIAEMKKLNFLGQKDKETVSDVRIEPKLYINTTRDYKSLLVWEVQALIGDNVYILVLDEESGKLVGFAYEGDTGGREAKDIIEGWGNYQGVEITAAKTVNRKQLQEQGPERPGALEGQLPLFLVSSYGAMEAGTMTKTYTMIDYRIQSEDRRCFFIRHEKGFYFAAD